MADNTPKPLPSRNEISAVYDFDEATGKFYWRVWRGPKCKLGEQAGSRDNKGYGTLKLNGRMWRQHRLAWMMYYGKDVPPGYTIDHINRDPADNRKENLRLATIYQQNQNRRTSVDPMRCIRKHRARWRVIMRREYRLVGGAGFVCLGQAAKARNALERQVMG